MEFYMDVEREANPLALPDATVFYVGFGSRPLDKKGWPQPVRHGWYWQRLTDCGHTGPFNTEADAIADARDGAA
ncbi:hypothetical protein LCGC14_0734110 [marine sediment metagenome]|uniref:Uncharacterized protein n=1 Tax=marine sediment metagenome TaxID=412755 RepID=A0A0F9QCT9_9ZZZZ